MRFGYVCLKSGVGMSPHVGDERVGIDRLCAISCMFRDATALENPEHYGWSQLVRWRRAAVEERGCITIAATCAEQSRAGKPVRRTPQPT